MGRQTRVLCHCGAAVGRGCGARRSAAAHTSAGAEAAARGWGGPSEGCDLSCGRAGATARRGGFEPNATLAAPGHPPISFPFPRQCDFLGELFEEKERETIETRAFPSHAFPLFVLSPFRYSVVISTLSALISRLLRPWLPGTRCAPTSRCPSVHLSLPGSPLGLRLSLAPRRFSALLCVPLLIGPLLLLGLYPRICGLCFLNEQL